MPETSTLTTPAASSTDAPFAPVVVAPTYNNAATLADILNRVRRLHLPAIVVNDGSTDATSSILQTLAAECDSLRVLTHSRNLGKAAALATGFAAAQAAGFTHVATIDTDGQLDPEQIPALLDAARAHPDSLVVGVRDETKSDYPARSRLGRRISNLMVRLESGLKVQDSQCGLRVYPVSFARQITCFCGRFCYETEIITRAGWSGCPVEEVPVNCVYLPADQRVSHFRPVVDTLRSFAMHLILIARTLLPWPHKRWSRAAPIHPTARATFSDILSWLSPAELLRQIKDDCIGKNSVATGFAIGVFIANSPWYGLQNALAVYTARRLHLHPLPVVLGAQLSMPPISFGLIAAALCTGHFLLHGHFAILADYHLRQTLDALSHYHLRAAFQTLQNNIGSFLLDWIIGSLLVGLATAASAFALVHFAFTWIGKPNKGE